MNNCIIDITNIYDEDGEVSDVRVSFRFEQDKSLGPAFYFPVVENADEQITFRLWR